MEGMVTRRLLSVVNRNKFARAIKNYVLNLVIDSYSSMNDVRDTVRKHTGVSNLAPYICEIWAKGLGMQTLNIDLMFTNYDILQFFIKTLGIKVDEQAEQVEQGVVDFYWEKVGEVLCWF